MRALFFLVLIWLANAAVAEPAPEVAPLRVGVSAEFEPIAFVVADELQGIEIDFARMLAARFERPLQIKTYAFKDLLDALVNGEVDVVMSAMSITEERKARVRFTEPYMEVGQMAIVRREDASEYGGPQGLAKPGLKVGVHQGSTGEAYVINNLEKANLIAYEGVERGLAGLREGEVDVFIHDSTTSWQLSRSFVNDNLMSLNRFLTRESIAWAVRKDANELQTAIDLVLKDMKSRGQVAEVIQKWLPVIPVTL
ncbi:MAG: substrate-binding periplasmic protein [Pseudomonadota bacterium]